MMLRFRVWLRWLPILLKMYRLNFWVWKNRQIDTLLGRRCNRVQCVLGEWDTVTEPSGEVLRYRPVRLVNGRLRWPFRRAYLTGFQLCDDESIPLIASSITEIVAMRERIRLLMEKQQRRRMQKEAFGVK